MRHDAAPREKKSLDENTTLLHDAASCGKVTVLEKGLELGFNIDGKDRVGGTALMRAADRNNVPAFKFLLSKGADLYAVDPWGRTALHSAAVNGASDIIAILMNEHPKFNVQCRDLHGFTPFRDATRHGHTECMRLLSTWSGRPILDQNTTFLHDAAGSGKVTVLEEGLELGFNIDGKDRFGGTALMRAADANNVPAFKFLLSKGADLYAVDSSGRTALHSAAVNGASDVITILMHEFPKFDINWRDYRGLTPLHDSGRHGYTTCINTLLDLGTDPYIRDNSGHLPDVRRCQRSGSNILRRYFLCCF